MIVRRLKEPSTTERLKEPFESVLSHLRRWKMMRTKPWAGFGEPFNGQKVRNRTVDRLAEAFEPESLIETGTFLGFTTRKMSSYGPHTYTVEVSPRVRYAARSALRDLDNVTMIWGDSAAAVRALADGGELERPLAYLDAHWEEYVPLADEVECLLTSWEEVLIVVDDFRVPGDADYGYDVYGGVPLSLDQLTLPAGVTVAFPAGPASAETGARRGTVYIGQGERARAALSAAEREGLLELQDAARAGSPASS